MLSIGTVVLGVDDLPRAKQFWTHGKSAVDARYGSMSVTTVAGPSATRATSLSG